MLHSSDRFAKYRYRFVPHKCIFSGHWIQFEKVRPNKELESLVMFGYLAFLVMFLMTYEYQNSLYTSSSETLDSLFE